MGRRTQIDQPEIDGAEIDGQIKTVAELEAIIGTPIPRVRDKARPALHELDRLWLAASPFCLVATSAADGSCDVSPKGDPAGSLVHIIDDRTIAIAERPGNRRVDGYRNILENPHVGLVFVIPGTRRHPACQRDRAAGGRCAVV